MARDGIRVNGHIGTWHVIDTKVINGRTLRLLEHDLYGDEAASVIIDEDNNVVMEDVYNGFADMEE